MDEDRSEVVCGLIASRTQKVDHEIDMDSDEVRDAISLDERGMYQGYRISRKSGVFSCSFPRRAGTGGGIPNIKHIKILGSTSARLAGLGHDATRAQEHRVVTSSLRFALETITRDLSWSRLGADPGSAITYSSLGNLASSEDVLLRLAADLGESLTGIGDWSDQADPDSLDLSNQLSAIVGSRTVGGFPDEDAFERLRSEVGVVAIVVQELKQSASVSNEIRLIDVENGGSGRSEDNSKQSLGLLIRSTHSAPDLRRARNEAKILQRRLHCIVDIVSMHMYLSAVLSQVRQELLKFVDELVSDTKSPRQRIDSVSKIWELRIASLWRLEGYWFLDEVREIETPERRLLDDVVISCGIERDWNRCRSDVERIAATADYCASHSIDRVSDLLMEVDSVPAEPEGFIFGLLTNQASDMSMGVESIPRGHGREMDAESSFMGPIRKVRNWLNVAVTRIKMPYQSVRFAIESQDRTQKRLDPEHAPRRLVQIHPFARRETIISTIGSRITTSALLTATAGLLLGLLLRDQNNLTAPHDALLLLVATIAFFFETLMLANVSRGLQFTTMHVARNAERASGVALFLGQYPFAIALALSMTRLIAGEEPTGEGIFLIVVVSVLTLTMMIIYFDVIEAGAFGLRSIVRGDRLSAGSDSSPPKYSILGRRGRRQLMTVLHSLAFLLLLGALNGVMSVFSLSPWWMWGVEFALVGMLAAMAGLSWLVAGYERYCWYEVDSWDCMGMEEASFLEEDWR